MSEKEIFVALLNDYEKKYISDGLPFLEIVKKTVSMFESQFKNNTPASFRRAVDDKFKSERIYRFICMQPEGVSKTAIVRRFNNVEPILIDSLLHELVQENALECIRVTPESGRGRPTSIYKMKNKEIFNG